jgi:hypothetical protein
MVGRSRCSAAPSRASASTGSTPILVDCIVASVGLAGAARCQLVVQFAERHFRSHAAIVAFEDRLRAILPRTCEVDGHDIGSGTINFFVYTAYPVAAYQTIFRRATTRASQLLLRIAYRASDGNEFTNLWPRRDPRPFQYWYESGKDPFARGARRAIPKRSPRGVRAR